MVSSRTFKYEKKKKKKKLFSNNEKFQNVFNSCFLVGR